MLKLIGILMQYDFSELMQRISNANVVSNDIDFLFLTLYKQFYCLLYY